MTRALRGRRGRLQASLALMVLVVMLGSLALYTPRSMALLKIGHLVVTHHQVRIKHPEQEEFKVLTQGKREWVLCQDVLHTMSKGTIELFLEPNTYLNVMPETVMTIKCTESSKLIELVVHRGRIHGKVSQSAELVTTIVNPSATLSTKGATFINQVDDENTVFVRVVEGKITITHASGTQIELSENQAVEVTTGDTPDVFKVQVVEGPANKPVVINLIDGVQVLVQPTDSVAFETPLNGEPIRIVAPAENKFDIVVQVGDLTRTLEPNDSALLTFREPEIVVDGVIGIPPGPDVPKRMLPPTTETEDFRDITDLLPGTEEDVSKTPPPVLLGPVPVATPASPTS